MFREGNVTKVMNIFVWHENSQIKILQEFKFAKRFKGGEIFLNSL